MEEENERMVSHLLAAGYADERTAGAMRKIQRELFVPEEMRASAYEDRPLPIGYGQTISAPSIVALMTRELDAREGMKVLDVGSGSGWQAALLKELVGGKGKVIGVEMVPELVELAKRNCGRAGCGGIEFVCGDGSEGYAREALYDRILVGAAAPSVPAPLVEQLKNGGRLIVPVGGYFQELVLVEKSEIGEVRESKLCEVIFVPLIGKCGHQDAKG